MPNADVKTGAPLCRAQNPELEIVKKFLYAMPHMAMDKKEYDAITESKFSGWTGTHYQMAKQMALYFTKDGLCIPRFQENVTTSEIVAYMCEWAKKYYAPNPFTKDLNKHDDLKPIVLYAYFSECIRKGITSYKDACESLFEGIQLNNMDKVKLMLNSFTDIYIDSNGVMAFQKYASPQELALTPDIEEHLDEESFFNYFLTPKSSEAKKVSTANNSTIQTIYYGCPGTGKSYVVKCNTEGESGEDIIWYEKPTDEDKSCKKFEGIPTDEEKKNLTNNIFRTTFHPDYDYATFVGCYKPVKENDAIDYKFIPQVFTNAYVCAYRHREDPVYLIIEEINRGNCAQIFGDLFQLLDRTNGESDYAIKPDTELAKYLASQGVPSEELKLPDNLHIYATMNTSDQSLFPMDSAFKRRWAMEYMPINYTQKKASTFTIEVAGQKYPWIKFLEMVNERIVNATDSEDKQMGEFFIKGDVDEREFKNKVMFYLWNDVCKDLYNPRHVQGAFFLRVKDKLETEKNDYFTFAELFSDRNKDSRLLLEFFAYLESKYKEEVNPEFTFGPIE